MPFIDEEKLVKLYDEIDKLSVKNEELRQGYIELTLKKKKSEIFEKAKVVGIMILIILLIVLSYFLYRKHQDVKYTKQSTETLVKNKIDSLKLAFFNTTAARRKKAHPKRAEDLIYTIQIGAFRKFNLSQYSEEDLKNFRRLPNRDLYTYSIGSFLRWNDAKSFLDDIGKIGIKDAFILPLKQNKRVSLRQAIAESKKN